MGSRADFYAWLVSVRHARMALDEDRRQLAALEAGAALPSPMGGDGVHVRGGFVSDSTQAEAFRRIRRRRFLSECIAESTRKLTEFKRLVSSAGLTDECAALVWARHGKAMEWRDVAGLFGMTNLQAHGACHEAEAALADLWCADAV